MLRIKNTIFKLVILLLISLIYISCDIDPPPTSIGLGIHVYDGESYNNNTILKGINASLRNDTISSGVIRTLISDSDGRITANFCEEREFRDWYPISFEEIKKLQEKKPISI